jgi:hypothetical protein
MITGKILAWINAEIIIFVPDKSVLGIHSAHNIRLQQVKQYVNFHRVFESPRVTRINRINEEGSRGIGNICTQTSLSSDINPS